MKQLITLALITLSLSATSQKRLHRQGLYPVDHSGAYQISKVINDSTVKFRRTRDRYTLELLDRPFYKGQIITVEFNPIRKNLLVKK